jgi:hypothetical protein
MIPKDQICRIFCKHLLQEPDIQDYSLFVQLLQLNPVAVVTDGISKIQLWSTEILKNIKNDTNSFLSTTSLLNSFLILRGVDFLILPRKGGDSFEVNLTANDCNLFVPGIYLERWGNPNSFDKKIEAIHSDFIKKVRKLISLSSLKRWRAVSPFLY